jgi:hypothetical protein
MRKTILKAALASLVLAVPAAAYSQMVGDCYDCHTMHNSEQGAPVASIGGVISDTPIPNLLRYDCIACHANNPTGGTAVWAMTGGSKVPQVMHGDTANDLAGGNWNYMIDGGNRKGHNVIDLKTLYGGDEEDYTASWANWNSTATPLYEPPGLQRLTHSSTRAVFTTEGGTTPFNEFTCAGARGCHGTRSQFTTGAFSGTGDNDFVGTRRTGMAAISGAHHTNWEGAKDATNYATASVHSGTKVSEGYRFIVGLKGYGNDDAANRWRNVDESSHNEYYGVANGNRSVALGKCDSCHIEGAGGERGELDSTIRVPNNSFSGFCSTCHGGFHSAGGVGTDGDQQNNGVAGAFLRHPSDYAIPNKTEYAAYATYDITAPVARASLASSVSSGVTKDSDMVMCGSCHKAHGSAYDYMLHFNYSAMIAGGYADTATATAEGGCLACHTAKGVLPTAP